MPCNEVTGKWLYVMSRIYLQRNNEYLLQADLYSFLLCFKITRWLCCKIKLKMDINMWDPHLLPHATSGVHGQCVPSAVDQPCSPAQLSTPNGVQWLFHPPGCSAAGRWIYIEWEVSSHSSLEPIAGLENIFCSRYPTSASENIPWMPR